MSVCLAVVGLDVGHGTMFLSQMQAELTLVSKTQLTGLTLRTEKTHTLIFAVRSLIFIMPSLRLISEVKLCLRGRVSLQCGCAGDS